MLFFSSLISSIRSSMNVLIYSRSIAAGFVIRKAGCPHNRTLRPNTIRYMEIINVNYPVLCYHFSRAYLKNHCTVLTIPIYSILRRNFRT